MKRGQLTLFHGVIYHDKVFMLDPASRFLDTPNAGKQTDIMSQRLKQN